MKSKINLMSHRILIKERLPEMEVGGIVMPDSIYEKSITENTEGEIIDLAPDAFDYLDIDKRPKIGNVIYFIRYDGIGKKYNNIDYRILLDESTWGYSESYLKLDEDLVDAEEER